MKKTHQDYLKEAIDVARENQEKGGGPFGALIVKDDRVIAKSGNTVTLDNDPTSHAEINVIRNACKRLGHFELKGCILYSSCEPCPMCLGAIYWSRLDAVYFSAKKEDAKDAGFDDSFIYEELNISPENRSIPMYQIKRDKGLVPFQEWKERGDKIEY
jgi:tRNA(Arg) A34 adenosine deaminase TadA